MYPTPSAQILAAMITLVLALSACSNMLDEKQGNSTHNWETGDQVTYTADDLIFTMVYVEGGYTFPTGVDDNGDIDGDGDQDVPPTATVDNAY